MSADNWWTPFEQASDGISPRFGTWALAPGSRDAVLTPDTLGRGAYSVQLTSAVAGQTGIALAEIYDSPGAAATTRELVNISARTQVTSGEGTLIAGFVISGGATARTVLIRAAGPILGGFGVTGTLADPKLALFRGTTRIAESDNWQTSEALVDVLASVGANTSGVALVEVYVLP